MSKTFVCIGNTAIGAALSKSLVSAGYKAAGDLDLADVVLTFCTSQEALEDVYFDTSGIIAKAQPGAFIIDCSPTTPGFAKELSAMAQVSDLHAVECPLYVRDIAAKDAFSNAGNLVALVSAEDDSDIEVVRPMIEAMASTVEICGRPGDAQLAKASLSLQQAAAVMSMIEALSLCRADSGAMKADDMARMELRLEAVSPGMANLLVAIETESFQGGNTVEVLMADLGAALAAADDVDQIMPQAESAIYLFQLLATVGGMDKNPAALSLLYADEATCAKHGLDWTRAEEAYESMGHSGGHEHHHHDHNCDDDCDYDDDDEDDDSFDGGFGGYSSN